MGNFQIVKNFVRDLTRQVTRIGDDPTSTQIALINYSRKAKVDFFLDNTYSRDTLEAAIDDTR